MHANCINVTWLPVLKAGDLGRFASQRPARVKIESSLHSSVQLPFRSLLRDCRWCHECVSHKTAGKPTEWIVWAWKFRTRALTVFRFYPDFSESGYSDFRALWSNSICSECARIHEPFDSVLAQLTVYPEIDGAASWKIYFSLSEEIVVFHF